MVQIGKKDRIFAAVVLPAAAIAAFVHFVRMPEARRTAEMEARISQLPDPSTFPVAERRMKENVALARAELEKAKAEKPPAAKVVAGEGVTAAERRERFLDMLRAKGAKVKSVKPADAVSFAGEALKATSLVTFPQAAAISVEAEYPAMAEFMKEMEEKKTAAAIESVEMSVADVCRWEIMLWF